MQKSEIDILLRTGRKPYSPDKFYGQQHFFLIKLITKVRLCFRVWFSAFNPPPFVSIYIFPPLIPFCRLIYITVTTFSKNFARAPFCHGYFCTECTAVSAFNGEFLRKFINGKFLCKFPSIKYLEFLLLHSKVNILLSEKIISPNVCLKFFWKNCYVYCLCVKHN